MTFSQKKQEIDAIDDPEVIQRTNDGGTAEADAQLEDEVAAELKKSEDEYGDIEQQAEGVLNGFKNKRKIRIVPAIKLGDSTTTD